MDPIDSDKQNVRTKTVKAEGRPFVLLSPILHLLTALAQKLLYEKRLTVPSCFIHYQSVSFKTLLLLRSEMPQLKLGHNNFG